MEFKIKNLKSFASALELFCLQNQLNSPSTYFSRDTDRFIITKLEESFLKQLEGNEKLKAEFDNFISKNTF